MVMSQEKCRQTGAGWAYSLGPEVECAARVFGEEGSDACSERQQLGVAEEDGGGRRMRKEEEDRVRREEEEDRVRREEEEERVRREEEEERVRRKEEED
eukprot:1657276-Rhodomonas_salina.1